MQGNWEEIALAQSETIEKLAMMCKQLLTELAMVRQCEKEESAFNALPKAAPAQALGGDMPFRLIGSLIVAALAVFFTGYNLGNRCNVWIFHTFEDVPVAVTIIVSLIAGVVITLPFTLGKNAPRKPTEKDMALLAKAQRKEARLKVKEEKRAAREARLAEKAQRARQEAQAAKEAVPSGPSDVPAVEEAAQPTTVSYQEGGE